MTSNKYVKKNIKFLSLLLLCDLAVTNTETWTGKGDNYDVDTQKTERLEDKDIFKNAVFVNPQGQVRPVYFNACSKKSSNPPLRVIPRKKVVSGRNEIRGEVPYQVGVSDGSSPYCGGSIYNHLNILTAAHCLYDNSGNIFTEEGISSLKIIAGDHDYTFSEGTEQERLIANYTIHPSYVNKNPFHDIAIIKVDKPFEYNKFVQPLPIGSPSIKPEGAARVSGWGYTKARAYGEQYDDLHYPNVLKLADIKIISPDVCAQRHSSNRKAVEIANHKLILCAGVDEGSQDTCSGDSGGPLACYNPNENNETYLCGIIATGFGCGVPGHPGFYTRVGHKELYQWIGDIAGVADKKTL